jgi:hypothetical protein
MMTVACNETFGYSGHDTAIEENRDMRNSESHVWDRVDCLERAVRRQRVVGVAMCMVIVILIVCAASAEPDRASRIVAKEFVLSDENGKTRAVLGMEVEGPVLRLLDEKGRPGLIARQTSISLYDENLTKRISVSVETVQNSANFCLFDDKGDNMMDFNVNNKSLDVSLKSPNSQFIRLHGETSGGDIRIGGGGASRGIILNGGIGPNVPPTIQLRPTENIFPGTIIKNRTHDSNFIIVDYDKGGTPVFTVPR